MNDLKQILNDLRKPFHPSNIVWKPGAVKDNRALAMPYADPRTYMNRLDEVCGSDWSVSYEPWGEDRLICRLTIAGVIRSSTGEMSASEAKGDNGGTVAEAQSFKRACAMFGLGRYLYTLPTGWADYDPASKRFTDTAKTKLAGMLMQHYRRATSTTDEPAATFAVETAGDETSRASLLEQFHALGQELYGGQWEQVSRRNANRISGGAAKESGELSPDQIQQLITGMDKLRSKRNGVAA